LAKSIDLNSLLNYVGNVIAPTLGGALFAASEIYGAIGLALGSITVAGAAILLFLAKDPTRTPVDYQ
jgi:hypothetical protein